MSDEAFSKACCDVSAPPDGSENLVYRQARVLTSGSLANVYLPVSSIPAPGSDFRFYNPQDGICYKIVFADPTTEIPGNVPEGWEAFEDIDEQERLCGEAPVDPVYYQARVCRTASYPVTAGVGSAAVTMNGGAAIPAGTYLVSYTGGALNGKPSVANSWGVGKWNATTGVGYKFLNAANALISTTPGLLGGHASSAAAIAANTGQALTIGHAGGIVKLKLFDVNYADNISAPPAPEFVWEAAATGELVDLWVIPASLPYVFKNHGVCYVVDGTSPTSTSPGVIADEEDAIAGGCGDGDCDECDPENFADFLAPLGVSDTMNISSCQLHYQLGGGYGAAGNFTLAGRTYHYEKVVPDTDTSMVGGCHCPNNLGFLYTITRTA